MKAKEIEKNTDAIPSTEGLPIRYDVYHPADAGISALPVVLFLHGFKGFKDWGTFPAICRTISARGFVVVAINFSLNGIGENKMEFDRLDLFARDTFSQDLGDVGSVISAIKNADIAVGGTPLNHQAMGILGHSRGGQTAVAAAAEYPEINCLVTWSAVADYNARWSEDQIKDWQSRGVTEIKNGRTGQIMPMKKIVYDDARENADRVIALNRVKEITMPALFIHAETDEAVLPENAQMLFEACASAHKDIQLIPDTGHTFGGTHPFNADTFPQPLQHALSKTIQWFLDYLK